MDNNSAITQPIYKIHGNTRREAKFVLDCMKRIINFYDLQKQTEDVLDYCPHFISHLEIQKDILSEKLDEKFVSN